MNLKTTAEIKHYNSNVSDNASDNADDMDYIMSIYNRYFNGYSPVYRKKVCSRNRLQFERATDYGEKELNEIYG